MITTQPPVEGKPNSFEFTTKDTFVNEVLMEVFNHITELVQAGAPIVKITVERKDA